MRLEQLFEDGEVQKRILDEITKIFLDKLRWKSELSEDLDARLSAHLGTFLKSTQYNDLIENALNEYITKDVAKQIVKLGLEQYLSGRRLR